MISFLKKVDILTGRKHSKIFIILISCLLISMMELVGLGIIGPFIQIVFTNNFENYPFITNFLKKFNISSHTQIVISIGFITIFLFIIKNYFSWILQNKIIKFAYDNEFELRESLADIFLSMRLQDLNMHTKSHYINVMTRHISQFTTQILHASLKIVSDGLAFILIIFFLAIFYPGPLMIIAGLLLSAGLLYYIVVKDRIKNSGAVQANSFKHIITDVQNIIRGIKEIRIYAIEDFFSESLRKQSSKNRNAYFTYTSLQLIPRYLIEALLLTSLIALSIGLILLNYDSAYVISVIGVFGIAAVRLMPGLLVLTNAVNNVRNGLHIFYELFEFFNSFMDAGAQQSTLGYSQKLDKIDHFESLEIKDLKFKYIEDSSNVLDGVNLKILKGESIGIVGKSGEGKSTLINLILQLYEPTGGEILVNGKNVNSLGYKEWYQKVAYIPQEKFIIEGTIKENIALGIPYKDIDNSKLDHAIKVANLQELVSSLPDLVDTRIGEDGSLISGGQAQRICLARAIYFNRELIVLDEATSSLDTQTEEEIIFEINQLRQNNSFIIISHRPSILKNCNAVFELSDGKLNKLR